MGKSINLTKTSGKSDLGFVATLLTGQFSMLFQTLIVSALVAVAYKIFRYMREQIEGRLYSSITISSSNALFKKVNRYLVETGKVNTDKVAHIKCKLKVKEAETWMDICFGDDDHNRKPQVEFLPGPGDHFIRNSLGKLMWIN